MVLERAAVDAAKELGYGLEGSLTAARNLAAEPVWYAHVPALYRIGNSR